MQYPATIRGIHEQATAGLPLFEYRPLENPFTYATQNWRLLERLRQGPTTNVEIVKDLNIFNSTGRISEVRQGLAETGWTVDSKRIRGGLWEYSVRAI